MGKKLNVVSLFTGAGGLDIGLEAAGFNIALASDIMPEAADTLRLNRPDLKVFGPGKNPTGSGDIAELTAEYIYKTTGLKPGEIDIMAGGPPCQSFSVAAAQRFLKTSDNFKRKGFNSDKGQLVFEYLRLIVETLPKVFIIENVPGFATIDNGKTIENLKEVLGEYNYTVNGPFLVKTEEYGVPQSRRRVILIGSTLDVDFKFPQATHAATPTLLEPKEFVSVAQALASLPKSTPNYEVRAHKEESIKRYRALAPGKRDKLGRVDRLDPNLPSKTIIAGGNNGGGRSHLHPLEARTLSVRESARIQTFPDDYVFVGKNGRQFTQVGNAVPVLLGEIIGRAIGEQYFGINYKDKPLKHAVPEIPKAKAYEQLLATAQEKYPNQLYLDLYEPSSAISETVSKQNNLSFNLNPQAI